MRVALASDHAGFQHKEALVLHLQEQGIEVIDFGPRTGDVSVDYPDFAVVVGNSVATGEADYGVLVCGTGVGMAIAANKVCGVRAANILSPEFAKLTRLHNDSNVVALSGRFVSLEENREIVDTFLSTEFEGDRHQKRIDKITEAESDR